MFRARVLLGLLAVALMLGGGLLGDDKTATPAAKARGQLPQGWGKLGLTDDQKQKIYGIQTEFRNKAAELEAKIKDLRKQERSELERVLSDSQKGRLKEILLEKAPGDTKTETKTETKKAVAK